MKVAFPLSQVVIVILKVFFTILGTKLSFGVLQIAILVILRSVNLTTTVIERLDSEAAFFIPHLSQRVHPSVASKIDYFIREAFSGSAWNILSTKIANFKLY
jgi:hypothetical protein